LNIKYSLGRLDKLICKRCPLTCKMQQVFQFINIRNYLTPWFEVFTSNQQISLIRTCILSNTFNSQLIKLELVIMTSKNLRSQGIWIWLDDVF
jgi:hypothetical protein